MNNFYAKQGGVWTAYDANAIYRKENGKWVKRDFDVMKKNYIFNYEPSKATTINYVSLGDSIAAGHTINADWIIDYGEGSQYGKNGNTETKIVPGCYTDLIKNELVSVYGADHVNVKSFARSGDTVADLMQKLSHDVVRNELSKANLVTICIGANDVLQPAMMHLNEYIETGSLVSIDATVESNLAVLNDDSNSNSYKALFDKLTEINPTAKYVFMTIYNPYKYLWIEEGHYGFFEPLLQSIPQMDVDVDEIIESLFNIDDLGYPWIDGWHSIELELDFDSFIKDSLLGVPIVQQLFDRVNGLGDRAGEYVTRLNNVLTSKINSYSNKNIVFADSKAMFDLFPDRTDSKSDVDYSDLVSVEFTREFDVSEVDWGQLWKGSNATTFWTNLAWKYASFTNAVPSLEVWDYVSFDMNGFAAELVGLIVEKVITPDVDPHPEYQGHQVLKRSFTNMYGLIKYETDGSYVAGDVVVKDGKTAYVESSKGGYKFDGWGSSNGDLVNPNKIDFVGHVENYRLSDLVNGSSVVDKPAKLTPLYARWKG